ncbi:hypothetical protein FQA39_LY04844 [Lamprigera yunnana]|nr:hypothetical protein FQA39_LY04844 [Lamprigera yunnana]
MKKYVTLLFIAIVIAVVDSRKGGLFGLPNKHEPIDLFKPVRQGVDLLTGSISSVARFFLKPFQDYQKKFNKQYSSPEEEKKRLEIFAQNQKRVNDVLKRPSNSFIFTINEFADLLTSEVLKFLGGLRYKPYKRISTTTTTSTSTTTTTTTTTTPKPTTVANVETPKLITTTTTTPKATTTITTTPKPTTTTTTVASITEPGKPGNIDWRRLNCMSNVRYQAKCSASFSFATTAAIEAHICYKTGKRYALSPQNLIDCTIAPPFENSGCDGGALEPTYDYVVNVGINTEDDYVYEGTVSKCKFNKDKSIGKLKDYVSIDEGDEETMEYVLNNYGPITVGLDATHESFRYYGGGIYYEPKCKSSIESLNHAVLLIGYGIESDGQKYWLIRNSYGTSWGTMVMEKYPEMYSLSNSMSIKKIKDPVAERSPCQWKGRVGICELSGALVVLLLGIYIIQTGNSQLHIPRPLETVSIITKPIRTTVKLFTKQFSEFKNLFNKKYSSKEEEEKRLNIFSQNHVKILEFKKLSKLPFVVKVNEFCDLISSEFNKLLNGLKIKPYKGTPPLKTVTNAQETPIDEFDWRTKGIVTPIRNQGECASCYAFAATAAIESHNAIKTGKQITVSPQDLVDCSLSDPYENYGCDGGSLEPAYDFIKDHGVVSDKSYPYTAETGEECKRKKDNVAANIKGYSLVEEGNDEALKEALVKYGPIPVGINAGFESFQFYGGGIYYEDKCKPGIENINHAVLLVGYGENNLHEKYWLIKNSYGPSWGENGYGKIARNVTNHCGISTYAVFPEL